MPVHEHALDLVGARVDLGDLGVAHHALDIGAALLDPTQIYQFFQTCDTWNLAGWSDPEFDRLITEAASASDPARRAKLVVAQGIAAGPLIWIPLYASYNPLFLGKGLTGAPTFAVQLVYPWAADIAGLADQ